MRHLYLLRGVPGVGKSTLIKEFGLEQFTLSADGIRKQFSNTEYQIKYNEEGEAIVEEGIQANKERRVWEVLLEMLENRMKRGETTIIDATHSSSNLLRTYNKLVEKYRYRTFTIQINRPLEDILESNRQRPEAKRLPDSAVIKKYNQVEHTTPNVAKRYGLKQFDNIQDAGNFILENSTWRAKEINHEEYKKVYVIGDIHASYDVLKEFMDKYYSDDNYYVFVGDYLDRGLKPYETVKLLHELHTKKNVVLLRGNHETNYESWLATPKMYSQEEIDRGLITEEKVDERKKEIKKHVKLTRSSNKYLRELKAKVSDEEFNDFTKKLTDILRRVQDVFMFTVQGQEYVVTHGGIVANVLNYRDTGSMINFSADAMIRGVGTYDDNIDEIYNQQMLDREEFGTDKPVVQIHGHRNTPEVEVLEHQYSFNVEQGISDGGYLGAIEIDVETGNVKDVSLKNNNYRLTLANTALNEYPVSKLYEEMEKHNYIRVKPLTKVEGVYSINITEKAFYERVWDEMTVKARGLFVNPEEEKVVARSYNKFFNLNERSNTRLKNLDENMTLPVTVSSKVNGFLGIMTVYKDEFLFLSKSTDGSKFSQLFKDTFLDHANVLGIDMVSLKEFIKREDVSLVFEVVDNDKDPHIIKYENKGVVLLDVFKNQLEEELLDKHAYKELELFVKPEEFVINSYDELKSYVKGFNKGIDIRTSPVLENVGEKISQYNEGVILTDAEGFRIKIKGAYYNVWKSVRPIIYQRLAGKRGYPKDRFGEEFLEFISEYRRETITDSLLIERDEFVKQYNKDNEEG